jgi:hypothetical protein
MKNSYLPDEAISRLGKGCSAPVSMDCAQTQYGVLYTPFLGRPSFQIRSLNAQAVALPAACQIPDDQGLVVRNRKARAAVGADGAARDPALMAA